MKLSTTARIGVMTEPITIASKSFAGRCQIASPAPLDAADHVDTNISGAVAD